MNWLSFRYLRRVLATMAIATSPVLAAVDSPVRPVNALPSDVKADDQGLDPAPLLNRMNDAITEIQQILEKQRPTNDKLVIRCVEEKLTTAQKARTQAVAVAPDLKKQMTLSLSDMASIPTTSRISLEETEDGKTPAEGEQSPQKTLISAADQVERQLTGARLCTRIQSGELVNYDSLGQNVAGEIDDDDIEIPEFADIEPVPVEPPVSLVN